MKKLYSIVYVLAALVGCVQAQNEEVRSLDPFDKIKVSQSINVEMVKGAKNEAIITSSGVSTDKVLLELSNGTLSIKMESGTYRSTSVKVLLTYSGDINEVRTSSSAKLSGADKMTSDNLFIKTSSSSRVNLVVDTGQLKVDVSSSGKVQLAGRAQTQVVEVSSSGKYDAFDLESEGVKVDVSSSGKVNVNVSEEIFADASSSGKVSYKGSPQKVIVDTSSSGSVSKY